MGSVRGVLVGGMSDIFRAIDLFCNFLTWAKIWMVIKVAHHCTFKSHQLVAVIKLYNTNKAMMTLIEHSYDNDLNPPDRTFWFWSPQGTSRSHSNATQQSHLLCCLVGLLSVFNDAVRERLCKHMKTGETNRSTITIVQPRECSQKV